MSKINIVEVNNCYVVDFKQLSGYFYAVEIDGVRYEKLSGELAFTERPKSIRIISNERVLDYILVGDKKVNQKEFNAIQQEVLDGLDYYCDDDGERIFENLDYEYVWKKFISQVKYEYKQIEKFEDVEITFFKAIKSEYPEIRPLWSSGESELASDLCHYSPSPFEYFEKIAAKYGKTIIVESGFFSSNKKGFSVPSHSTQSLRFLQYNGNYIDTPWKDNERHFCSLKYSSYSECVARRERYINEIEGVVRREVKFEEEKDLSKAAAKEVFEDLVKLQGTINKIESKQKTDNYWRSARTQIEALKNKLTEL